MWYEMVGHNTVGVKSYFLEIQTNLFCFLQKKWGEINEHYVINLPADSMTPCQQL